MKKGFTLIELMVSVIIIGLLSAIITVSVINSRQRAANTKVKSDVDNLNQALVSYLTSTNKTAPITKQSSVTTSNTGYTKAIDDSSKDILQDEFGDLYGLSLREIFLRYTSIPFRTGTSNQNCIDSGSDATDLGYCYLRYPTTLFSNSNWSIYSGLPYPDDNNVFFGSVNGQLKALQKNSNNNSYGLVPAIN